jgi:hypothetical protein
VGSSVFAFRNAKEEVLEFIGRLNRLGARQWHRDAEIVKLFCGRGNGLVALQRLGFTRLEGVDLSRDCLPNTRAPRGASLRIAINFFSTIAVRTVSLCKSPFAEFASGPRPNVL